MSELDRLRAELEYTSQRGEELSRQLANAETEYGSPVNTETINDIISGVADVLRRGGNSGLADRYLSAFHRFMSAGRETRAAIAREDDNAGEHWEATDDLGEEFERIASEVSAWLDDKLSEGQPS